MNDIKMRTLKEANYIIKYRSTIRETAKYFKNSKSTTHKDLSKRLYHFDQSKYIKVQNILTNNFKTRHIKGGEATRRKYSEKGD